MTAQRSRKEELTYKKYVTKQRRQKEHECVFCAINSSSDQLVRQTQYFKVIVNIFPYSVWDGEAVDDHLMIVPIKHTDKLGSLPAAAASELLQLIDSYEDKGYNLYARAPGSAIKSVIHQHSHLIKPKGGRKRLVFYLRKPYIRIVW